MSKASSVLGVNGLRNVAAAWGISRLLGFCALVVTPTQDGRWFNTFGLTTMDGGWYRMIIDSGYPGGPVPSHGTVWPFFPLYPGITGLLVDLGVRVGPALIAVSWISAFAALAGIMALAHRRFGEPTAVMAVWLAALVPGSLGLVLSYSDGFFVAGAAWTLFAIDVILEQPSEKRLDLRWAVVGTLALMATSSRPNGVVVAVVAVVAACRAKRFLETSLVLAPSLVFLGVWMMFSESRSGDPLAFVTAKSGWTEIQIWEFIAHPTQRITVVFHVLVMLGSLLIAGRALRRLPNHWLMLAFLLLAPSMVLGMEGLARYSMFAVPLTIAMAIRLIEHDRSVRISVLMFAGFWMMFLGVNVVRYSWVP